LLDSTPRRDPALPRDLYGVGRRTSPPGLLVAKAMVVPVVSSTERYGEFVADLASERAGLREPRMVGVRGASAANQTRLRCNERPALACPRSRTFRSSMVGKIWLKHWRSGNLGDKRASARGAAYIATKASLRRHSHRFDGCYLQKRSTPPERHAAKLSRVFKDWRIPFHFLRSGRSRHH
jgi:hypothetical protein